MSRMVCQSINQKKSMSVTISKSADTPSCNLMVNGEKIEQFDKVVYVGSAITQDGRCDSEIRRRVGISKTIFWVEKKR